MNHRWLATTALLFVACHRRAVHTVPDDKVEAIVARHCRSCHSDRPTIPAFPIAPAGVELDRIEQVRESAARVRVRVLDGTMPLLNKTEMTEEERSLLTTWAAEQSP